MIDIAPYTKEEAAAFGSLLHDLGCPSLGPHICSNLLHVVAWIQTTAKNPKFNSKQRGLLMGYSQRLLDVCSVDGAMQANVIKHMEQILKGK